MSNAKKMTRNVWVNYFLIKICIHFKTDKNCATTIVCLPHNVMSKTLSPDTWQNNNYLRLTHFYARYENTKSRSSLVNIPLFLQGFLLTTTGRHFPLLLFTLPWVPHFIDNKRKIPPKEHFSLFLTLCIINLLLFIKL